jgi:hypothetical protein
MDLNKFRRSGWEGDLSGLDLSSRRDWWQERHHALDTLEYIQRGLTWLALLSLLWLGAVMHV